MLYIFVHVNIRACVKIYSDENHETSGENDETSIFLRERQKFSLVLFVYCHSKPLASRFADHSSARIDNDLTDH